MSSTVTRYWLVAQVGASMEETFQTLRAAQDEARAQASTTDGQFAVFELVDCYQAGPPPIDQVIVKK